MSGQSEACSKSLQAGPGPRTAATGNTNATKGKGSQDRRGPRERNEHIPNLEQRLLAQQSAAGDRGKKRGG